MARRRDPQKRSIHRRTRGSAIERQREGADKCASTGKPARASGRVAQGRRLSPAPLGVISPAMRAERLVAAWWVRGEAGGFAYLSRSVDDLACEGPLGHLSDSHESLAGRDVNATLFVHVRDGRPRPADAFAQLAQELGI